MTITKTTKTARDAAATPAPFQMGVADESGTGAGPFPPYTYLTDGADGSLISPMPKTGGSVLVASTTAAAEDGMITTGGTAQELFSGATPAHGFAVYNPDATNVLWISDSVTAAANEAGCIIVPALGSYVTPVGYGPIGSVSIVGANTGQKFTARRW